MKAVYLDHLIEIQEIGNGPNTYFWISLNGKRVAIAYESPLDRAKEIVDLKLRGRAQRPISPFNRLENRCRA